MCGITGIFNHHSFQLDEIITSFNKGKARGPEYTSHESINDVFWDFTDLLLMDLMLNQINHLL